MSRSINTDYPFEALGPGQSFYITASDRRTYRQLINLCGSRGKRNNTTYTMCTRNGQYIVTNTGKQVVATPAMLTYPSNDRLPFNELKNGETFNVKLIKQCERGDKVKARFTKMCYRRGRTNNTKFTYTMIGDIATVTRKDVIVTPCNHIIPKYVGEEPSLPANVKIESNIPIPEVKRITSSPFRTLLLKMKTGDSVTLSKLEAGRLYYIAKMEGIKVTTRVIDKYKIRTWKL